MRWYGLIGLLLLPIVCHAELPENSITTCTSVIGTPEQPTIEGGWINQARKGEQINQKNKNVDQFVALSKIPDEFNSSKEIEKLLTLAGNQNKLAYVLQRAKQMNLPATVALIPMVESRYQTHAVSPKGASGAWQLMPATAKNYGLDSEDRENFMLSTNAALQVLKNLHQQFGNWTLAFAAYNAGSVRVKCALLHRPDVHWMEDLDLPLETKHYLSRLRAIYQMIVRLSINDPTCL